MNYQKQYANKIGWQNSPDTSTPINATNLGKMDNALWYMDDAMYVLSKLIAGGSSVKGGIITNVGSNIFTTHLEMRSGEDLSTGELLLLRSNVSGSGNGINVYIDEYMAVGFGFIDLSGTATSVTLSSSSVLLLMLDVEENTAQVLSVLGEGGGGGLPETPLAIIHGGTGNTAGYIQTGRAESTTIGLRATAEGGENESSGEASHAEGSYNEASGNNSHAEGYGTTASDLFAHAEGYNTTASEDATHAEGRGTTASDWYAHAEGHDTTASGESSHAEGASTIASNTGAHSEGISTTASGHSSHAGGVNSVASGTTSFAQGLNVTAGYDYQTVVGKYNNNTSGTLFEIGNGTASNAKSNALEVYSDGRVHTNKLIVGNDNQVGANTVTGIAMGMGVTAGYENQVAVGVANNNRSDTLFEVGNGSIRGQHTNAFEVYSNGNVKAQGTVSDANGVLNVVTANPSDTASTDLTKIKIGNTAYNIPSGSGGSGNTKLKTRYSVTYSSWSSAVNSDGYYTYNLTLSPTLDTTVSPDVLIAGSNNITQPTDTEKTMFGYVERCYLSSSTLTLYAKTKPTNTFYVWVEGIAGSGSGGIVGNVVQPNGKASRVSYSWTSSQIGTTVANDILSHIDEINPDSYVLINGLIFRLFQYVNTSSQKRLCFSIVLWNGVWTYMIDNTESTNGIIQLSANASNYVFTGEILPGTGILTTWGGSSSVVTLVI